MMRPQLVAHRGDAENYPENSLPALQAAVDCGVRCLEFDVQLTADAVPVVIHDTDLRRTGARPLSVLDTPWDALRACSVGEPARFADRFNAVRVPTLERIGCWLREWPEVTAFVELKPESLQRHGVQTLLDKVAAVLKPVRNQVVLISCARQICMHSARMGFERCGWVLTQYDEPARRTADRLRPDFLICNCRRLPPSPLSPWSGPWQWMSYEVESLAQLEQLQRQGITLFESMRSCTLQRELRKA